MDENKRPSINLKELAQIVKAARESIDGADQVLFQASHLLRQYEIYLAGVSHERNPSVIELRVLTSNDVPKCPGTNG